MAGKDVKDPELQALFDEYVTKSEASRFARQVAIDATNKANEARDEASKADDAAQSARGALIAAMATRG
jgi:hypothetical protein